MRKDEYSIVAGRGGSKLVKFMHYGFPVAFGVLCIIICVLVWIAVLTV